MRGAPVRDDGFRASGDAAQADLYRVDRVLGAAVEPETDEIVFDRDELTDLAGRDGRSPARLDRDDLDPLADSGADGEPSLQMTCSARVHG